MPITETEQIRRAQRGATVSAEGRTLDGYPIVFDSLSLDLGGFQERIAPESVDRALSEGTDVRALLDHDPAKVLGRTRAGTLTLRKTAHGLHAKIEPDTEISYARDILRSVARGDVSGMSFGFRVVEDAWDYESADVPIRTILDMRLSEVSVVTWPAYEATSVDARAWMNTAEATRSMGRHRPGLSHAAILARLRLI